MLPVTPRANDAGNVSALRTKIGGALDSHVFARRPRADELRELGGNFATGVKHEAYVGLGGGVDADDVAVERESWTAPFDALGDSRVAAENHLSDFSHQRNLRVVAIVQPRIDLARPCTSADPSLQSHGGKRLTRRPRILLDGESGVCDGARLGARAGPKRFGGNPGMERHREVR